MSLTADQISSLINKYTPVIWVHPDEQYFPCSIDWLIQHSTLVDFNDNTLLTPVTQRDLYNIAKKYGFGRRADGDVVLSFNHQLYKGQTPLDSVPCYAISRIRGDKLYITYIFLYAYNGEYWIVGIAPAGMHPGDVEHMTAEIDIDSGALLRMFYGSHGTVDGTWVNAKDIEFLYDHPVAYQALHGHGMYPKNGTVFRSAGFTNDHLGDGFLWSPKAIEFVDMTDPRFDIDTMGWTVYNSRIGGYPDKPNTEGITGLPDKSWMHDIDNPDPAAYKPQSIYSPTSSRYGYVAKMIGNFALIYVTVYMVLKLVSKIVPSDHRNMCTYTKTQHIVAIVVAFVAWRYFVKFGTYLINRFTPGE